METIQSYEEQYLDACAIAAMQGELARHPSNSNFMDARRLAKRAYQVADSMLVEKRARAAESTNQEGNTK